MAPAHDEHACPEEVLLRRRESQAVDCFRVHGFWFLRIHVRWHGCNLHPDDHVL
jgi:hypothetical protein